RVVELGCGCGWITLAIALYSSPKVIYGVDINPRAIICSQLNLYLNALDSEGEPILDEEDLTLLDRVKFTESDLLEYFFDQPKPLDRIIGCIPQVLNPELEVMRDLVKYEASDEFLHSLSNYCEKQGYIEDQFGLGLLAKATEQAIKLLRPTGKVVLNFGGRPGATVLERLMTRRGLGIRPIWATRVKQDPDTDISGLVAIERATGHRFEFFMTPRDNQPISAATAKIYSEHGGEIFHSVVVYEGILAYPTWLKQIFTVLEHPEFAQVKSALDLTESDSNVAEERFYWLASLFSYLDQCFYFPYGLTEGELALRERIVAYFHNYHSIPWNPDNLVITPSRGEVINNLLTIYEPSLVTVDRKLRSLIPHYWQAHHEAQLIETPSNTKLLGKLMRKLKPSVVITGLSKFEIIAEEPFESLVNIAGEIGALLVVDISDNLNLSSHPKNNGLFEYLAGHELPSHVILLADLIKNKLYPDFSLCIGVTSCVNLRQDIIRAAELTYSRFSWITQFFYQQLLEQLLYFQTPRLEKTKAELVVSPHSTSFDLLPRSPIVTKAFQHPAIQEAELPFTESSIRLDSAENCLASPVALKEAIAESFARRLITPEETTLHIPLAAFFAQRYQIKFLDQDNFLYGPGVSALFTAIVEKCRQTQGTFIFPQGAYGIFRAALDFQGVTVKIVTGQESENFKLNLEILEKILQETPQAWLYLNAPLANPTGAYYSSTELQKIIKLAWQYNACVVLDVIFSGLEFAAEHTAIDLSWMQERRQKITGKLIILGGITKEFAAAGVRFGYLYSPNPDLVKQLKELMRTRLPQTIIYAMVRFYEKLANGDKNLKLHLESQRKYLQQRAQLLRTTLQESGWTVMMPQGGLFLVAKPSAFLGRTLVYELDGQQQETVIDGDTITTVLFYTVGLNINSATWTNLPNYCRFALSGSETAFQDALQRIREFYEKFSE
ncbi:MAG: aminotransferase class I/II-fold pyridoxal phosphate-dependent enzyme, partial [Xenococcus sp. (in: cyanobacteria)]